MLSDGLDSLKELSNQLLDEMKKNADDVSSSEEVLKIMEKINGVEITNVELKAKVKFNV